MENAEDLLEREYFYIMHLSYNGRERRRLWEFARRDNLIGLSMSDYVTDDWNRVRDTAKDLLPPIWVRQFDMFCNEMKINDIVLVLNGWDSLLGIAKIAKHHYQYDFDLSQGDDSFFDHVREVEWNLEREYDKRLALPQPIRGFNNTLSKIEPRTHRWSILSRLRF